MITSIQAKQKYGIFCSICNTDTSMEVSETVDSICYCTCTKCGNIKNVQEFTKVKLSDGKSYIYSALLNAFYTKGKGIGTHYNKFGFTKTGALKKKDECITYREDEFNYLETNKVA